MAAFTRRGLLAGAACAGLARTAAAQDKPGKLTVLGHRVHQLTATQGKGGDATAAWREQNGVRVDWVTLDIDPIHDRLFREASLSRTEINIGFMLNARAVPGVMHLFEPIDAFMASAPIEDFSDIQPKFVATFAQGGQHFGIPYRHAVDALHYNKAILQEREVEGPPKTIEDFLPTARKLSFTRPDGTKVAAFAFEADNYNTVVKFARAFGGDFITEDYKIVADQPPMVQALQLMQDLFKEGHLPKTITAMNQNDLVGAMQTGQVAMMAFPFGRTTLFNDPKASKYPGQFVTGLFPGNAEMTARGEVVSTAEFWAMTIPKNSTNKDLAWSLIRELSTKHNTVVEAANGNGPVRLSAYQDATLNQLVPYAATEAIALKWSRVPMPAFNKSAQAKDICIEEMQAAMLGMQSPQESAAT